MQYVPQPLLIGRCHYRLLHNGKVCPLHLYVFKSTTDSTYMAIRHIMVHKISRYTFRRHAMMLFFIAIYIGLIGCVYLRIQSLCFAMYALSFRMPSIKSLDSFRIIRTRLFPTIDMSQQIRSITYIILI